MNRHRSRVLIRLGIVFALVALSLLIFNAGHHSASASTYRTAASRMLADGGTSCPPEANSCTAPTPLPCVVNSVQTTCGSVTAGPVSELGQGQAVYVDISGLASGAQVALGFCPLAEGTTPAPDPACASYLPPGPNCGDSCDPTPSPLEWQYATGAGGDTVLSIGTEFDPNISGATPITSQNEAGYHAPGQFGSFFCDNGPADPCGIEVMYLGSNTGYVIGDGYPPAGTSTGTFVSSAVNTLVIPLNWASTGSGCQSAPILSVDASYSVSQFLPAAGSATCAEKGGVAVLPTSMPSVDDATCASSGQTHCPITDVIKGVQAATFTDDPNDPATLAALQQAGGKFAYIPIAVSSTEIAFEGQTGRTGVGSITYPLSSYNLTPAQAAGIMTQEWTSPIASLFQPQDDLCGELSGTAQCSIQQSVTSNPMTVYDVNGQTANLVVSNESGGQPQAMNFPVSSYSGTGANAFQNTSSKPDKNYAGDTGYALLNPWPGNSGPTPTTETNLDAMFPSTGSGASYETTGWICAAPEDQFSVNLPFGGTALLTDLESGKQLLANAEQDPIGMTQGPNGWVENSTVSSQVQADLTNPNACQAVSTLPTNFATTVSAGGGVVAYSPSSEPLTAAHSIQGAISKNLLGFAFSAMDSSEADFYGLLPANLQNAQGSFVAPSTASILAALGDETPNANGTLSPNFSKADAAAYPMPMVTYALISTSPQPSSDQADQLTELLTNLVNYSSSAGAGTSDPLPPGYVALPSDMANAALAEISKDIIAPNGQPVGGAQAAQANLAANAAASSASSFGSSDGSFPFNEALGAPFGASGLAKPSSGNGTKATPQSSGNESVLNPIGRFIAVTLGDNRYLVPGLLLLALLCLVAGPLLYLSPSLKKPATAGVDGDGEGVAGEGGDPPADE